jgi:hypothetical protein
MSSLVTATMLQLFFEIYKQVSSAQRAWHFPNTLPTIRVLGAGVTNH